MNKVLIIRDETGIDGTFGRLFFNGELVCKTGELPEQGGNANIPNEKKVDCIPKGTYQCEIRQSPKFGKTYWVKNVPNREYILIHKGNYCGDKSKGRKSDVEGCIILGEYVAKLGNQRALVQSKSAFEKFMLLAGGEPFELTIQ